MFNSHAYHSGTDPSFGFALGASAKPLSADGSQGQNDGDPCTTSDGSESEWHGETCVPIKGIVEVDVDSGDTAVVVDTGLGKLIENVDASIGGNENLSNKKPDYPKLRKAINSCAKSMYSVELTSATFATASRQGSMSFRTINGTDVYDENDNAKVKTFVVNTVTSKKTASPLQK